MPMTQTLVASFECTEPTALPPTAPAAEHAQQPRHLTERSAVESGLGGGDLFGLQNVEFHDVFGGLELPHPQEFARLVRVPEVVRQLEFIEQRPQVRAFQDREVGAAQFDFAEV